MFNHVAQTPNFQGIEHDILRFWEEHDIFHQLVEKNKGQKHWSFIDGPITANNPMGVHHAWGRTYKDIYQRYKAMQGFDQRYQNGFDCQGLWLEVEVEKALGLTSKKDIQEYGLAEFSRKCKERAQKFAAVQTEQSKRLGQWMHWDNSYYTMTDLNIETIWNFLKTCYERGWLNQGQRAMPWCARCGTSLSHHELMGSYKDMTHESVFFKLPLIDHPGEFILVWTTTPWTLAANTALAVNPDLQYLRFQVGEEIYYLSQGANNTDVVTKKDGSKIHGLIAQVSAQEVRMASGVRIPRAEVLTLRYGLHLDKEYQQVGVVKGQELVGRRYQGPVHVPPRAELDLRIIPWEGVGDEEGTGVVHIAPGCGAEDYELSKEHDLAVIVPIDDTGTYYEQFGFLAGKQVQFQPPGQEQTAVAQLVFEHLKEHGYFFKTEHYHHRYPVCWRCREELLFRVVDEWFIRCDEIREPMKQAARQVRWIPPYAGERMQNWLDNMGDWCISRRRFWGLPLPFYPCSACGHLTIIGSQKELRERAVEGLDNLQELHRPWIDAVKIACPKCGAKVSRITEVGDCWLDAGIVPFSTLRYHEPGREYWQKWFPADFICEMVEQVRLWFYSLLFMSVTLEKRPPYCVVKTYAAVVDQQGEPFSKTLGNAIPFDEAAEKMGADVMRWLYAAQNIRTNLRFGYEPAKQVQRKLLTLWNVYRFFITYANLDQPDLSTAPSLDQLGQLDRWLLCRLHSYVKLATERLDRFDVATVMKETDSFLDDLSNWYLRRSRRRFWKSESDQDKLLAYQTLYTTLTTLIRVLAPVLPFFTEHLYQNLVRQVDPQAPPSVHLTTFPQPEDSLIDPAGLEDMRLVMLISRLGHAARDKASLKVRQPVGQLLVYLPDEKARERLAQYRDIIGEELNVKKIEFISQVEGYFEVQIKPNYKLLGPKLGKALNSVVQALQKMPTAEVAQQVAAGENVTVTTPDGPVVLAPAEIEVQKQDAPGYAVAEEHEIMVALATTLTPELIQEGYIREIIRHVQTMRKQADLKVDARICLTYATKAPELQQALEQWEKYLCSETLAQSVQAVATPQGLESKTLKIGGQEITVAFELPS